MPKRLVREIFTVQMSRRQSCLWKTGHDELKFEISVLLVYSTYSLVLLLEMLFIVLWEASSLWIQVTKCNPQKVVFYLVFGLISCVKPKQSKLKSNFCTTQLGYRFILRILHSMSVLNANLKYWFRTLGSLQFVHISHDGMTYAFNVVLIGSGTVCRQF